MGGVLLAAWAAPDSVLSSCMPTVANLFFCAPHWYGVILRLGVPHLSRKNRSLGPRCTGAIFFEEVGSTLSGNTLTSGYLVSVSP